MGKALGPNSIPGVAYKNFARLLAFALTKSTSALQQKTCEVPWSIGQRIGKVIPKMPRANTEELMRDLEMPSEHRKVLEQVLSKLIGERATASMQMMQQAFPQGRNRSKGSVSAGNLLQCRGTQVSKVLTLT